MLKRTVARSFLALAGAASLFFSGCNKPAANAPAPMKIAFVTNNASEFWKVASAGVKKFEKETGVDVTIYFPPGGKVEEQIQELELLRAQQYDGVGISPISPDTMTDALDKTAAASKLVCFDSDAPNSKRMAYVGTLNVEAGKMLGQEIVKLLPQGGKIGVFVGTMAAKNAQDRLAGIKQVVEAHNISVEKVWEDNVNHNTARSNVEDCINAHGDIKLVCGLWSYNGPAIAAAITGLHKEGKVLAAVFDDDEETFAAIKSGVINCTAVQRPFDIGYQACMLLYKLKKDGDSALPADKVINTGAEIVNKDNVDKSIADKKALLQ